MRIFEFDIVARINRAHFVNSADMRDQQPGNRAAARINLKIDREFLPGETVKHLGKAG